MRVKFTTARLMTLMYIYIGDETAKSASKRCGKKDTKHYRYRDVRIALSPHRAMQCNA